MRVALCLLTYNERPCLEQIFPLIPEPSPDSGFDQLVAIDGGSIDGTAEYYRERAIQVIGQSRRGRGDAFLLAFEQVNADGYIFFSPDGNEDAQDLPKFKPLLESGADLVIASRMMRGAVNEEDIHLLKPRKWANNSLNLMANVLFRKVGPFVTDSINGYRAVSRRAAEELKLNALDYTIEYQMTIRALKKRMAIVEFPTREGPRVAGVTGAPSLPTGLRFLKRLWAELQ
jgi:glycosyltransferase involved in cell wall biosynthesis